MYNTDFAQGFGVILLFIWILVIPYDALNRVVQAGFVNRMILPQTQ